MIQAVSVVCNLKRIGANKSSVGSITVDFDIIKVVSERHLFSAFTLILPCVNTVTDSYKDILSKVIFCPERNRRDWPSFVVFV